MGFELATAQAERIVAGRQVRGPTRVRIKRQGGGRWRDIDMPSDPDEIAKLPFDKWKSLYREKDGRPRLRRSVVAFIDLLGYLCLSETHTRMYRWCSPPKTGTANV